MSPEQADGLVRLVTPHVPLLSEAVCGAVETGGDKSLTSAEATVSAVDNVLNGVPWADKTAAFHVRDFFDSITLLQESVTLEPSSKTSWPHAMQRYRGLTRDRLCTLCCKLPTRGFCQGHTNVARMTGLPSLRFRVQKIRKPEPNQAHHHHHHHHHHLFLFRYRAEMLQMPLSPVHLTLQNEHLFFSRRNHSRLRYEEAVQRATEQAAYFSDVKKEYWKDRKELEKKPISETTSEEDVRCEGPTIVSCHEEEPEQGTIDMAIPSDSEDDTHMNETYPEEMLQDYRSKKRTVIQTKKKGANKVKIVPKYKELDDLQSEEQAREAVAGWTDETVQLMRSICEARIYSFATGLMQPSSSQPSG